MGEVQKGECQELILKSYRYYSIMLSIAWLTVDFEYYGLDIEEESDGEYKTLVIAMVLC